MGGELRLERCWDDERGAATGVMEILGEGDATGGERQMGGELRLGGETGASCGLEGGGEAGMMREVLLLG